MVWFKRRMWGPGGGGGGFSKKLCRRLVFRIANWVNGVTFIYNADFSSF